MSAVDSFRRSSGWRSMVRRSRAVTWASARRCNRWLWLLRRTLIALRVPIPTRIRHG